MRWIITGFLAYVALAFLYAFARDLWRHDGVAVVISAILLTWACVALYGSI